MKKSRTLLATTLAALFGVPMAKQAFGDTNLDSILAALNGTSTDPLNTLINALFSLSSGWTA